MWASSPDGCEAKMLESLWLEKTPAWYHDYRMSTGKVYLFECKLQIIIIFLKLYVTEILEGIYLKRLDFLKYLIMGMKTASLAECCTGIARISAYF